MSSCFILTIIATIPKNTFNLHSKTDINNNKLWKMVTIVEFQLLVLDSLNYSSKLESPINSSAKAVISRNLTPSWQNHLFIYLFIYLFNYLYIYLFIYLFTYLFIYLLFIYFFIFLYICRKQKLTSYLQSDSDRSCRLAWLNKKKINDNLGDKI